jgi:hypothetical protein
VFTALCAGLSALAASAPAALAADEPQEFGFEGTWYVLIHYRDSDTANPDVDRWDDRIWVFERKGSRLKWTEYPIVVFNDRDGRFEQSRAGQTRVLHAWQPNSGQQAQIAAGLEFNSRGSKSKSLRRKRSGSWQSSGPPQASSASVIGYHETWKIEGSAETPTFSRDDMLGSKRTETMSGRTVYAGETRSEDLNELRGSFARDESRRGSFRMMRTGAAKSVGTKRSQKDRIRDALRGEGVPGVDGD